MKNYILGLLIACFLILPAGYALPKSAPDNYSRNPIVDGKGNTRLHKAASKGDQRNVMAIVQHRVLSDPKNNQGQTPLILAAEIGNVEVMRALLNAGADPSIQDHQGKSALFYAAKNRFPLACSFLFARGAVLSRNWLQDEDIAQTINWSLENELIPPLLPPLVGLIQEYCQLDGVNQNIEPEIVEERIDSSASADGSCQCLGCVLQ